MATYPKCSRLHSERRWLLSRCFLLRSKTRGWIYSVRALRIYIERSAPFRQSEQLFVCFGGHTKGSPVTKQRLSRWIIDAIKLAYSSLGQLFPMGVRDHSTRGIASSSAWSSGVQKLANFRNCRRFWARPVTSSQCAFSKRKVVSQFEKWNELHWTN